MKKLLKELCAIDGVSGFEDDVRRYIEKRVGKFATTMETDSLGNLIVFKKGAKRRKRPLMVCAHMDEVGFLVSGITEGGMLKIHNVGGIDPRVVIGRRMRVGENKINGVIAIKAIHLTTQAERKIAPPLSGLFIDIGCGSRAEAEGLINIGDPAMFDSDYIEFGDKCVKAKAIDDRVGCAVMIKMLEQEIPYDTFFVFGVGEEIGHGALVAARRVNPGAVLIIEGTTAGDMPDVPEHMRSTCMRQGAVVSVIDRGTVYNRELRDKITAAADKKGIKWQYRQSANGGTDASVSHEAASGALAFGLAAPVRYIHCACNVAYYPDLDEVLKMAVLFNQEVGDLNV